MTDKQIERERRSVLHRLERFGTHGAYKYTLLEGYSWTGRQIRLAAIAQLLREQRVEQIAGQILRIKKAVSDVRSTADNYQARS